MVKKDFDNFQKSGKLRILKWDHLTYGLDTAEEGVSSESRWTKAHGSVTDSSTFGIWSARCSTWINAFAVDAGLAVRAFAVTHAFWLAIGW